MSANFWTSTHCKRWLKSEAEVYDANRDLKAQATPEVEEGEIQVQPARGLKLADLTRLREWLVEFIQRLGKSLKFRTTVIATAIVYFKRFFLKTSFAEFDPMLLVPTCIYLAGKVEEHQAGCAAVVKMFTDQIKKDFGSSSSSSSSSSSRRSHGGRGGGHPVRLWADELKIVHVMEAEKVLLERINFDLVVFHPYVAPHRKRMHAFCARARRGGGYVFVALPVSPFCEYSNHLRSHHLVSKMIPMSYPALHHTSHLRPRLRLLVGFVSLPFLYPLSSSLYRFSILSLFLSLSSPPPLPRPPRYRPLEVLLADMGPDAQVQCTWENIRNETS